MRYLVGYAAYAIAVCGLLVHLVPPQAPLPPLEPAARPLAYGTTEVTLAVVDDYFSQRCTVAVSALAADTVVLNSVEEFERLREQIGC
jgi:hypothetical protein